MYEFKKTEDQELLLESLKEVYERNDLDAYFKECDEKHEFPQKAIDVMVDAGFATLGIPEQYGGTEVDILTQCMVVEQACALGFPNLCWMNFACEVDDKLAAKKAVITTITADDIPGLDRNRIGDPGSPTKVPRMFPPVMPEPGIIIDEGSVEASVAKLMQLIKD